MSEELKNCPFCGDKVESFSSSYADYIEHPVYAECECIFDIVRADIWQSRPIEDALRADLARVSAERDEARAECLHSLSVAARINEELVAERDALKAELYKSAHDLVGAEQERDELTKFLDELQEAEAHYRLMHDTSPIKLDIGRAWDLMKRAGNRARAALEAQKGGEK